MAGRRKNNEPPRRTPRVAGRGGPAAGANRQGRGDSRSGASADEAPQTQVPQTQPPQTQVPQTSEPQSEAPQAPAPPAQAARTPDTDSPDADSVTTADISSSAESADGTDAADATGTTDTPDVTDTPDDTEAEAVTATTASRPSGKRRPPVKAATISPTPRTAASGSAKDTARAGKPGKSRERTPFWTVKRLAVVATVAVLAAIAAIVLAFKPGVDEPKNTAFVDRSLTSEVAGQAATRICSVFGVNYGDFDKWAASARANLVGKAAKNLETYLPAYRDLLKKNGNTAGQVDCHVDTVGVRSITGDTATVLSNMVVSASANGISGQSGVVRVQATMTKVDGKWLVSDFDQF